MAGAVVPSAARAQERFVAPLVFPAEDTMPEGRLDTWRTHAERAVRIAGHRPVPDPEAWVVERVGVGAVLRTRVAPFERVASLLEAAQQHRAALEEGRALALLARAERIVEAHADVPGAAPWLAEVETAIGITAAQAGSSDLAQRSLARAATLDPTRGLRPAEAPPDVVSRAGEIARAVATRPTGAFEVRADAPGARVFLDDALLGDLPLTVRAPVGTHVLRVEAAGRLPYGQVLEVLEGERPALSVRLSPDPAVGVARRLEEAARRADVAALREALARLEESGLGLSGVWIVRVGAGPRDRALLTPCTAEGCGEVRTVEVDEVPLVVPRRVEPLPEDVWARRHARGVAWLGAPAPLEAPVAPAPAWYERWWVWAGAAVVVGAAVGAAAWLAQPEPAQRFEVEIDPTGLAR